LTSAVSRGRAWFTLRVTVACACCALRGWTATAAASDYLGKTVGSVTLSVEGHETTEPALMQVVVTTMGQPLSMAQVRETIAHLYSFGRFEDVRADATLENGRVALRYDLAPIHPVTKVRFEGSLGLPGIDTGAFRQALFDRYGATPPLSRQVAMTRIIADALAERGYLDAVVIPNAEIEHSPERATLVFTIEPGARTTIGDVSIVGEPSVPQAELLDRLGLRKGAPYEREALSARIERYVEDRRKHGYYEAKIDPAIDLAENQHVVNVRLNASPGPHVRVVFNGDALPSDRRDDLVPVEREGSVDEDLLEDSTNRIEEGLRVQGYRDAKAPFSREQANGELVITFAVKRGPLYRVTKFDVSGNAAVPLADFGAELRTREGQPFSDNRLDADASAIEDVYHRRGFASARAQPSVQAMTSEATAGLVPVRAGILVVEGVQTTVDAVTFAGNVAFTEDALRRRIRLQPGGPYVPGQVAVDRDAIEVAYRDLGYESVTVQTAPEFSQNDTHVAVRFYVSEGPQIFVDRVIVVGNVRTRTELIERELRIKGGDPLSLSAINESQRRLAALGLFRRARITELSHGGETTRDLLVTVEEAPPTTIGYGGGVEGKLRRVQTDTGAVDEFQLAPRASFEIGRRNLLGKNRSVDLFTSVAANRFGLQGDQTSPASNVTEYRVVGTFREPRLFNTTADAFLSATIEQQLRTGFNFARKSLTADVARRLTSKISVSGDYQLQRTRVFDLDVTTVSATDQQLIDRTFPQFLLSSFSGTVIRDTRNDPVEPSAGNYESANVQLALRAIGSEFGFVKSYFTGQIFRTIPHTRRIVFAGNARVGMANGFTTVTLNDGTVAPAGLPPSERFFAGGDTTNRGFTLDTLGVRHFPPQAGDTIDTNGFPIGGNGMVILMGELRAPLRGGLGVVGFVDTGNVFAKVGDIDVAEFRTSVGSGVRYKSPVGPLRFDFGVKLHREPGEGRTAWFVSFGQAF
jgi:outer membrane protein insertion porin family